MERFREYSEYGEFPRGPTQHHVEFAEIKKTSQELRMLSTVTLDCQVTKIVMNLGSQL